MVVSFCYAMLGPSQKPTDTNTQEDSLALYTDYFVAILLKKKECQLQLSLGGNKSGSLQGSLAPSVCCLRSGSHVSVVRVVGGIAGRNDEFLANNAANDSGPATPSFVARDIT